MKSTLTISDGKIKKFDTLFAQFVDIRLFEKIAKSDKLTKTQKQTIALNLYALSAAAYERLYLFSKTTLTKVDSQYEELNDAVEKMFSMKEHQDRNTVTYYLLLEKHLCDIFGLSSQESIASLYLRPCMQDTAVEREAVQMTMSKMRTDLHKGAIMCGLLEFLTPYVTEVFRKFNHRNKYVEKHDKMQERYGYLVLNTILQKVYGESIKEITDPLNVLFKKIAKEIQ